MSVYQYITGDELEDFHICTYVNVDALYDEAEVMGQVSQAERWVNEYCGQSFIAGAAPDGVEAATLEMARFYMNMQFLVDGHIKEFPIPLNIIEKLCKNYLEKHKVSVPYTSSASDYDLRTLKG